MSSTTMAPCIVEAVRLLALNRLPRSVMEMPGTSLVISPEIAMKEFGVSTLRPIAKSGD